jgi:3-deoxy-7-phosphoheptulonate synthase
MPTRFRSARRNMQNFSLLRAVGKIRKPVLLKRGMSAKIEELLLAAEYLLAAGNEQVVLCERGIRTFETATRNTLDLNAIPYIKQKTHLPVLVDPSHGTGHPRSRHSDGARRGACGADGCSSKCMRTRPSRSRRRAVALSRRASAT